MEKNNIVELLRRQLAFFAALTVLLLILTACVQQGRIVYPEPQAVARINGTTINQRELDEAVERLIPASNFHGKVNREKREELREQALQNLIIAELQYQDACARGLKPDRKLVQSEMQQVRSRFKSTKEYRTALDRARVTEDKLRLLIEKRVLIQTAIEKIVTEPASVSETELKNYYESNTEKFEQPESMRLRIISTADEVKAKQAFARIIDGEDFATVAAAVSEDNYRIKGGDIGYIHRGRIYPELEALAVAMEPGEIRGPVAAKGMWFVIKLEDRKAARQLSYEESREKLKIELEKKKVAELMDNWTSKLGAGATIEVLDQN